MSFDYEKSLWGKGEASLKWTSPTSFRLERALDALINLPSKSLVLEVGTGIGQFIRAIKKNRPELICHGCDISKEALDHARQYNDGVEYVLNSENLPYADSSVDAVVIFDVLEHVEHPQLMIKEVNRVLKRGGLFYCFVPCEGDKLSLWNMLDTLHLKNELTKKYAGHINYFSRGELKNLFIKNNFEVITSYYSEHLVGQIIGIIAFLMMHRAARRRGLSQINNETYFEELKNKQRQSRFGRLVRDFVNSAIYLESKILQRIPSPNIHLVLKKLL